MDENLVRSIVREALSGYVTVEECDRRVNTAVAEALQNYTPWPMKIFGLNSTLDYARRVAGHLGMALTPHTEDVWEDGEPYVKSGNRYDNSSVGNVRGHKVFVIQSLFDGPTETVAEKFLKLLFFCQSITDASAYEVIPVVPHLILGRQDRKTESRALIGTKAVAQIMESSGISRVLMIDCHNLSAEQNAFRVPIDNLECKGLFADWCARKYIEDYGDGSLGNMRKLRVMTPDSGGLYRCERFRTALVARLNHYGVECEIDDVDIVVFDKRKVNDKHLGGRVIGDVRDADVIGYDDMISTMKTMRNACEGVQRQGGTVRAICATHGFFCGEANRYMREIDSPIVIADSVDPYRVDEANRKYIHIVDTTPMLADAIQRIHSGTGSITELLRD